MNACDVAAALVRAHEGCRLEAYQDVKGVWTIGFGHTGPEVHQGLIWTQAQADAALLADLAIAEKAVRGALRRLLADGQLGALISLAFNVGGSAVAGSNLMKLVNACWWVQAAKDWLTFDHAAGTEDKGLLIRRMDEALTFLRAS